MNPISEEGRVLWYDLIIHKKSKSNGPREKTAIMPNNLINTRINSPTMVLERYFGLEVSGDALGNSRATSGCTTLKIVQFESNYHCQTIKTYVT